MGQERGPSAGRREGGFTLVEVLVAFTILAIIMAALAPAMWGTLRATGVTNQRSQAVALAVQATEQLRSIPYAEVGYQYTPSACIQAENTPVTLSSAGPLDSMTDSQKVGTTTYTIQRCIYWVNSSIPGDTLAYKQTQVQVSWASAAGTLTVNQTSALYPGGLGAYAGPEGSSSSSTTTTTTGVTPDAPGACNASPDPGNPSNTIDVGWSPPTAGVAPAYYVVYYTTNNPNGGQISQSLLPFTQSPNEVGTALDVTVGLGTYFFQVEAFSSGGLASSATATCSATTTSAVTTTTTTVPATTFTAAASAQAIDLALGGSSTLLAISNPATTAVNSGSGSNAAITATPAVSIPVADNFLTASLATQIAEANTNGTSYACAAVMSAGGSLTGGSTSGACSLSGNSAGGVTLNITSLPGVGSSVTSLLGGITLNLDAASSWASGSAGGASYTGEAELLNATVSVKTLLGVTVTVPLGLSNPITSPTDLVKAITTAMTTSPLLSALASPVESALAGLVSVTAGYQNTAGGVFTESALHVSVLSGGATADLALTTTGPNTTNTTTTTTTTVPATTTTTVPCSINSLVVNPSIGSNGKGVALDSSGHLADESSFSLSVNVNPACSDVVVGYAPSGCTPGANGCSTSYATMTGSGTAYGTAGSASTVWAVGTSTFTVFTGGGTSPYSPLTQQQIILCTENGKSGKC